MPSPGSYTEIFGGNNVYPSQPSYLLLSPLAASVTLGWPIEQAPAGTTVVADIIDVNPTAGGLTIQLSDATQVSEGYTALLNNIGANSFNVLNFSGGVIATVASGTVWQLYLSDNTTQNGTWRAFQFGVGTSSATAAALAGAGLIAITTTLNENMVTKVENTNYNSILADRASVIEWTGGAGTVTLPNNTTIPAGWFVALKNSGTGVWTASVTGGNTIDGATTLALNPEQSCWLVFDGNNFYTLGLGQVINSIFDFDQINLTGLSGNVVLTGAQLNRISYRFIGALAGNVNIVVPATVQQYWIDNETTGAFTLTVQTTTPGTTTAVSQGSRNILYSDGINVVPAVTFGSTGFANGTLANPSIFFNASPSTGLYSPGTNQIAVAQNGVNTLALTATGNWGFAGAQGSAGDTVSIAAPVGGAGGTALLLQTGFSSILSSPLLTLLSTAANGSVCLSMVPNNGLVGTNGFSLFVNGATGAAFLEQLNAASFNILVHGTTALTTDSNGQTTLTCVAGGGTPLTVQGQGSSANTAAVINATVGGIALRLVGSAINDPLIRFDGSADTGATTATFTATNKPGTGTTITNWLPINADGNQYWIPLWAN